MGRRFTFVGLVQSAAAGNAPRFIKNLENFRTYIFDEDSGTYTDTWATDWHIINDIKGDVYSMNEDYVFEALDQIDLKKEEKRILESFIRLNDNKRVKSIMKYRLADNEEFCGIAIYFTDGNDISVERFTVKIDRFANMELGRNYSEMELNLFEEGFDE